MSKHLILIEDLGILHFAMFGILWIFSLTFFSCFCLLGLSWDLKELSNSPVSRTVNLICNQSVKR